MVNTSTTRLASQQLTRADSLTIDLRRDATAPPVILINWPAEPTVVAPHAIALSDLARNLIRALGDAQTELFRMQKSRWS
jgi:hypothetical protein